MASESVENPNGRSRYGVAVLAVAVCLAARWGLSPWLHSELPFLTVFGAVAVAVWYGGWGPGTLAAVLGYVGAVWIFFAPEGQFTFHKPLVFVGGLGFFGSCAFIIVFGEAMLRARAAARLEATQRAESEEGERRQREFLKVTLASIGDGVVATDTAGKVFFLNGEAERLTGWSSEDAAEKPLADVFNIVNETTRQKVENPVEKVLRTGKIQGLANHTILISKSGSEVPIDDSAAPIQNPNGELLGVILVFRDVTEQRRAMMAADRLASIVEHSAEAIFTKDLNGNVQTWNSSARRLFGYEAEEIVGKHITMLFPPDRLGEEDHILGQLRSGQAVDRYETVRVAKDGRHLRVQISVSPLKDDEGHIIGASKIVHDVTEIAEAREALTRERELLATTLASIGDAVIVTDTGGNVTFLNREAERLTGWNHHDSAGKTLPDVFKIVNEDTREAVEDPVAKVLRVGDVVGLANHTVLIAKDGSETPIDDSAAPIRGRDGTLHGVVLVFRDFSERKQSAEALRNNYERSQLLASTLNSLLSATDAAAIPQDIFGLVAAPLGIDCYLHYEASREKVLSMQSSAGIPSRALESVAEVAFGNTLCGIAAARGEPSVATHILDSDDPHAAMPRQEGIQAWASLPLVIGERLRGTLAFGSRQRKEFSPDDVAFFRTVAQFGAVAMDRLQREEVLLKAKGDLESALQAKDQFLAQLSHELRTPLNPVLMLASARASDPSVPEEVRRDLEMIRRNIALEARLIDDLLDLTRIARGKLRLRQVPCDVHEIVRDAIEIVRDGLFEKQIQLETKLDARRHRLKGDVTRLHQVFWNLLSNAVKFTPPGRSIRLRSSDTEGQSGWVITVTVSDEGVGFPPEHAESLFEPFRQVDEGGSVGLGLGLSIARAIVKLHQGTIAAHSDGPGKGAEFTVTLPIFAHEDETTAPDGDSDEPGGPPKSLRLLVVEDHQSTLEVITRVLERAGHRVTGASTVAEARAAAGQARFDGLITDLGLPDGSGAELLQELQSQNGGLPGIALSGYGAEDDLRRSMEAGFLVHIVKPVQMDELHRAIKKIAESVA